MTNYNMLSYKMLIFLILISQCNGVDVGPCGGAPPRPLNGICGEGHDRFYYRSYDNSCSSFIFQNCTGWGFAGNLMNNFMTLEECQNTCQNRNNDPTPPAPPDNANCTLPTDVGFINMSVIGRDRYYYNATLGKCLHFVYSGIGGNANNFETEDQCNKVCYPGSPSTSTANMSSSSSFIDPGSPSTSTANMSSSSSFIYPGSPTAHMSSSSSGYLDAATFTLTVQTLPLSSGTTMTMINDLTDIYHRPSSTRQSSKTSSTIFVVSETSSPAKPINVYLYASIGVIVIIVLFLILASAVLISMYIWFKQAIVNDSSCMEAVAPSTSSAPWQSHAYLAVIRSNKSHNAVPCSPVSGSSSSSVDC